MKIKICTKEKIFEIEEEVNLGELINELDKMFPNEAWKKYNLQCKKNKPTNNPSNYDGTYPIESSIYPYIARGEGTLRYTINKH